MQTGKNQTSSRSRVLAVALIICSLVNQVFPQAGRPVAIHCIPPYHELHSEIEQVGTYDSTQLKGTLTALQKSCWSKGYLTANYSIQQRNDTDLVSFYPGNYFSMCRVRFNEVPLEWLSAAGYSGFYGLTAQMDITRMNRLTDKLLSEAMANGYPFATVNLDSVLVDSVGITASLNVQKGLLIVFDTIDFGGTARVSRNFLQNYVNIKPGQPFDASLLKNVDAKLSELPFLTVARPAGIYFYGNKARPYFYLNHNKANTFDGVIGVAPNSSLNNKLVITGDVNLKLPNILGTGKGFEMNYRGYLNNSQDLMLRFTWPYFLNTRLGIDESFKLTKFDTTYLDISNDFGLQYRFSGNNMIKLIYQTQVVSLIYTDTGLVSQSHRLPAFNDVRNNLYGLGLKWVRLDYFINPSHGFYLECEGGAGVRQILKNSSIESVKFTDEKGRSVSVYDNVRLKSIRYRFTGQSDWYIKLFRSTVLHTQVKGGFVQNSTLFLNELFRIGGLKSLKGFDEQSIFASRYGILNVEYRYLFDQNSNFLLFWNGAVYKNEVLQTGATDKPWGIGAGMNIQTGTGVLSVYYAIGKQHAGELEWRRAKIHIGLVNYF